jgi:hypothetical protein
VQQQGIVGAADVVPDDLQSTETSPIRPVMVQAKANEGNIEAKSATTASVVRKGLLHFRIIISRL